MISKRFFLTLLTIHLIFFLCHESLMAQNSPKNTFQTWGSFNFSKSLPFSSLLTINPEINRLVSGDAFWRSYSVDNNIEYYPNNSWDLILATQFSYTYQEEGTNTLETRPYVSVRWNIIKPEKRFFLTLQGRYDFRFIHYYNSTPDSYSGRFRIKPELRISMNKKNNLDNKNLMLRLSSEYFIQKDESVDERFLAKRMLALGLFYRHSNQWRYELRYQIFKSKNTLEDSVPSSVDNVLYFIVSWYL